MLFSKTGFRLKRQQAITLSLLTLSFMLINYLAYYLDDIVLIIAPGTSQWFIGTLQAISWPVHLYIELIEKPTILPVPVLGRALNYCLEIVYFLAWTTPLYLLGFWLHHTVSPKLARYC